MYIRSCLARVVGGWFVDTLYGISSTKYYWWDVSLGCEARPAIKPFITIHSI